MFMKHINIALFNPLNAELNPICHLLALLRAHHILHVSRIRVKLRFFIVPRTVKRNKQALVLVVFLIKVIIRVCMKYSLMPKKQLSFEHVIRIRSVCCLR
jgi:hypothetical protein